MTATIDEDQSPPAQWISNSYQALARAMQSGLGLSAIVSALERVLDAPVCLVDTRGSMLASAPSRTEWNVSEILSRNNTGADSLPEQVIVPLELGGETVALLCADRSQDPSRICTFAADLIVAELGREQARLEGRRELAAQVLEDFFQARLSDHDAAERLEGIGVDLGTTHRVLVGHVRATGKRLRSIPWNLHTLIGSAHDPFLRAVVSDQVVLVVPSSTPAMSLAKVTHQHLSRVGTDARVGIGATYPGISGLRLSYYHARSAASAPGINSNMEMNLGNILMLGNLDLPLRSLSSVALEPLLEYDREQGGDLIRTLSTYLKLDCTSQKTAAALYIHRNTLRYRLDQIEALTKRPLSSFQNRMHFWIAIMSHEAQARFGLATETPQARGADSARGNQTVESESAR